MSINIFEGVGGSGKTTLIKRCLKLSKFVYIHEDRSLAPKSIPESLIDDYWIKRNIESMNKVDTENKNVIFDRSYIAALGVMFAKSKIRGKNINIQEKIDYVNANKKEVDNLIICLCDSKLAIERRIKRDGYAHHLWSNEELVNYINEFYIQYANSFSNNTHIVDTSNWIKSQELNKLVGAIK